MIDAQDELRGGGVVAFVEIGDRLDDVGAVAWSRSTEVYGDLLM